MKDMPKSSITYLRIWRKEILAQRERIEGERKQVTVLFTDLAGLTSMSEKIDPEEAFGLMERVL